MIKHLARAGGILLAVLITTPLFNPGAQAMTYPTLVGHRGIGDPWTLTLGIPEQSIPAIEWAAAHHADVLEGDVQVSASSSRYPGGVLYMMHDETLERTTNGTGSSTGRTWDYISQRKLEIVGIDKDLNDDWDNFPYGPPTFRSWLAAAKATGKIVFCELKNGPQWSASEVRRFWSEVKRQDMQGRVIVAGSESDLGTVKGAGATKRSMALDPATPASSTKIKSVVGSGGYVTLRLTEAEADPEYVRKLNADGFKVMIWTLTRDEHYARALPFGVYGWFCNNTDDAFTWLEAHGA